MSCYLYILHFNQPISANHTTQHYCGSAEELQARINGHRHRGAARLTEVAWERGIGFQVARVWKGATRQDERTFKARKNTPQYCPICTESPLNISWLEDITGKEIS